MMKRFLSTVCICVVAMAAMAQNIRYVCNNNASTTYKDAGGTEHTGYHVKGKYENDGRSWATAKENIQDAINDLVANGLTGEVWVAEGTYTPTESTESSGGSTLYMSFKIPAGITVRGGFHGLLTTTQLAVDATAEQIAAATVALAGESNANAYNATTNPSGREMNSTTSSSIGESTKYRTTLSGTLNGTQDPSFEWNDSKGQFDTQFYGNCYHVVFFATNGFDSNGRAKALVGSNPAETATALSTPLKGETEGAGYVAKLEGVIVKNGNAKNTALEGHPHNAYGGGVYMVPGSMVENVYFTNCEASRDGGAIYMDGGGIVRHCYIADCQALGVDLTSGYGGGICVDENKQIYPPQITRSTMVNCVGRYGGGMATKVTNTKLKYGPINGKTYDMRYNIGISANLITNCTATTEGGGAYSYQGGAWTHMTIVNNKCVGSGVTVNGMKTGQSAGMYVRDDAIVANSILWGGKTKATNDEAKSAQFALSRSTSSAAIDVRYVALSNVDNTNWSGVKKDNVIKLSNYNTHSAADAAGVTEPDGIMYPYFIHPSTTVGHEEGSATKNYLPYIPPKEGLGGSDGYSYKISYSSAASYAGILTNDLDYEDKTPAKDRTIDIQGNTFGVYPSLGAYVSEEPHMAPSVEYKATLSDGNTVGNIAHVYVDPNSTYLDNAQYLGSSWTSPIKNLSDALSIIEKEIQTIMSTKTFEVAEIHVHVKEGTVDMSGVLSTGSVRSGSLVIPDVSYTKSDGVKHHLVLKIMGGYDKSLTFDKDKITSTAPESAEYLSGHDLSKRNPILTPTVITGKVLNDYKYYIPHLMKIEGKQNVTVDGFQLRYANARSQELEATTPNGAAFTIKNSQDITIKNVLVAGCTADNGAAVYATGGSNVSFENCIFHNNETTYTETSGNIYCDATSSLTLNHCDVLRNVGYPFYNLGTVTMNNSIVYANMSVPVDDTNNYGTSPDPSQGGGNDRSLVAFKGAGTVEGSYNLFDLKSQSDPKATAIKLASAPWLQFNFDGGSNTNYPFFVNPTKNAGVSVDGDATYYGRGVNFQPHNGNPMVNNASYSGTHDTWGTDMSVVITRDYGGLPDIGALENHRSSIDVEGEIAYSDGMPAYGSLYFVRDYDGVVDDTNGGDGSSWTNAINGNGYYHEASGQYLGAFSTKEITYKDIEYVAGKETEGTSSTTPTFSTITSPVSIKLKCNGSYLKAASGSNNARLVTISTFDDADKFILIGNSNSFQIYDVTQGRYIGTSSNNPVITTTASYATNWKIDGSGKIYYTSGSWKTYTYYWTLSGSNLATTTTANQGKVNNIVTITETEGSYKETEKTTTVTGINGLQYAVNKAGAAFAISNLPVDVWVAEGTYTNKTAQDANSHQQHYAYMMKEGVNVIGGFPKTGNPGLEQRNPKEYVSILQVQDVSPYWTSTNPSTVVANSAASIGRVLVQPSDFTIETTWNGFTLRHGYLNSYYQYNIAGNISAINTALIGDAGGAGAYLMNKGVLENCELKNNVIITDVSNNRGTNTSTQTAGGLHQAGAGIYITTGNSGVGGTVKNSIIANNQIIHKFSKPENPESSWMYGGGLYLNKGTVYNTIIHDNELRVIEGNATASNSNNQTNEVLVGAGAFLVDGSFYNNTVVGNQAHVFGTGGHNRNIGIPGVYVYTKITMYNSIVAGNTCTRGATSGTVSIADVPVCAFNLGDNNTYALDASKVKVHYSFIDINKADGNNLTDDNDTGKTNIYLDTKQGGAAQSPAYTLDHVYNATTYKLESTSPCINTGTEGIDGVTIPDVDAAYSERVQDCTIDIGAYEFNDAYHITPDLAETGKAIFYVTPNGVGTAGASSPTNAACAAKLQKVIDAAGRYKYNNPTAQVIVKVANSKSMEDAYKADPTNNSPFAYYAGRTTDYSDQDIRVWSIDIPRGVEVWGGYSDCGSTGTYSQVTLADNGFYSLPTGEGGARTDRRDILANPTYFDAAYYNKDEKQSSTCYHVVSFTDKVYDGNGRGYPYITADTRGTYTTGDLTSHSAYDPSSNNADNTFLSMSSKTTDRAVIDGIFIQGGKADIASSSSGALVNMHQYGGAAIVTEYAHVRNCIATDNQGKYGGAFAVTNGALISGTLVTKNQANYGGAVYVFENGTKLSDGTVINTGTNYKTNDQMPHIYTSTIVNNKATKQGGGLWFTDNYSNVRINSTVLWQNQCNDEANVYGLYSPEKADDQSSVSAEAFFPFAYSAVQNMRVSGTNNMSVETNNANGLRIHDENPSTGSGQAEDENALATDHSNFADFGYWRPTTYSVLLNTGMPKDTYNGLISTLGLAATDYSAMSRLVGEHRTYVDIGARALEKPMPNGHLMIRLFVAKPEDVDMGAAAAMMKLDKSKVSGSMTDADKQNIAAYYKQEGSSFAYPFQSLQDALDYIVACRSVNMQSNATQLISNCKDLDKAVDVPFEIYVAKGEYYPTKDLVGNYGESLSNTFAIPEGVAIYGGFNCLEQKTASENNYFGGYQSPKTTITKRTGAAGEKYDIWNNVLAPTDASGLAMTSTTLTFTDGDKNYNILLQPTQSLLESRPKEDINKNSIIEPWEFENQTVLSGNTTNESADGVYHVVSVLPDENIVGQLPPILTNAGYNYYAAYVSDISNPLHGYQPYETGQKVVLNGLTVSGGYAEDYKIGEMKDELSQYIYFKGGGLVADGNRYNNSYNEWVANGKQGTWTPATGYGYKHNNVTNNVAYHNVPIDIVNCKFRDNVAGFGGAIAANCEMLVYGSSFENNLALAGSDTFQKPNGTSVTVEYPGQGGAILNSYQFSAYNTLFANNEAQDSRNSLDLKAYKTYDNQNPSGKMLGGAGGAMYFGKHGYFHIFNCDIVRNKANAYPAIFTANPNYLTENWKNGTGTCMPGEYNLLENTVLWGNELNDKMTYPSDAAKYAASLICNLGKTSRTATTDYSPAFTDGNVPTESALTEDAAKEDVMQRTWMETAWFCAYENGRGLPAKNAEDMRAVSLDPTKHIVYGLSQYTKSGEEVVAISAEQTAIPYQNSNIIIDSENATLEGPNFGNPSQTAGNSGYREDSDWSPSRICNLTDNGSGKLDQTKVDGEMAFVADAETGVYPGSGTYWTARYQQINDNTTTLPIGNEVYMHGAGTDLDILRISLDPNPTHGESYIDIGVYEYVHTKLEPTTIGDEVDILWVSNEEKYGNGKPDGSSWAQPTSDLQRAIETLLASRNGHRKEVRLMEGEYSPVYTINGHQSFYIDTKYLNASVELPEDGAGNLVEGQGVKSFTIKGGYSKDLMNQYDVTLYPSVIKTKTRSNATEDDWDHAIYIADATQRYGIKTGYEAVNGFGWWETEAKQQSKPAPTTVPIQIDGVSVVNNQALPSAKGAAIYYADQSFNAVDAAENPGMQNDAGTVLALAPASANITTSGDTDEAAHTYATKTNPAKLILSKTHVYDSGAHDGSNDVSAVYIGKYGGEALIYNNVFHSNYGDPLVAYAAKTINNTYALNGGKVDLKNNTDNSAYDTTYPYKSTIMNSALWKNASTGSATYSDQFSLNGTLQSALVVTSNAATFSNNSYTGGNTTAIDYDYEKEGNIIKANNYNTGLKDENSDAIYGPNFMDPENAVVAKRDFSLKPSLRLLNHGSNALYSTISPLGETEGASIYEYAWVPTVLIDAAGKERISNTIIDLGAFEFQSKQKRILYVIPSRLVSGTGESWSDALGNGKIQAAIDLAAVYYKTYNQEAYVFVRSAADRNEHTGETITLRNGVSIYGSIDTDWNEVCQAIDPLVADKVYADATIDAYINKTLMYHREGVVGSRLGNNRIYGINTNGTAFDAEATRQFVGADGNTTGTPDKPTALIDGFEVTNNGAKVTSPVIRIAPKKTDTDEAAGDIKMCLRNILVDDNDYIDGEIANTVSPNNNLVDINNALLYECLIHSNQVNATNGAALKVGQYGYVVNATVEGKTIGADGSISLNNWTDGTSGTTGTAVTGNTPASHVYNSITNYADDEATWKTLSGYAYKMDVQSLNYQLAEGSKYIDALPYTNPLTGEADNLAGFITYEPTISDGAFSTGDHDILGNMRLQTLGGKFTGKHQGDYTPMLDRGAFETWKVTRDVECVFPDYPHDGSVEYIMDGKSLIIDPVSDAAGDNRAMAHFPGFILLQKGASLYGNGRAINAGYVAIERNVKSNGSVVAMPYKMDYKKNQGINSSNTMNATVGVAVPSYDANGVVVLTEKSANVYKYNGANRSNWKYEFHKDLSSGDCWDEIEGSGNAANAAEGVLLIPAGDADVTLRFTAKGTSFSDYIYKEEMQVNDRHQKKTVTLTKYDDSESTSGGADFTEAEDQGWNCIGLPYLVNGYSTIDNATANATVHGASASGKMMQNPHTMWLYYDGKKYSDGTTDANGDGGFYSVSSWDASDWHVSLPEGEGQGGAIWAGEGFFVQNRRFSGNETLTFYRPVAPELNGGSSAKGAYNSRYYFTDGIKEIDKPISFPEGEDQGGAFIRVINRTLYISDLMGGEDIRIYTSDGRLINAATAESETYTSNVIPGIIIVTVNSQSKKIIVK